MGEVIDLNSQRALPGLTQAKQATISPQPAKESRASTANPPLVSNPWVPPRKVNMCWACGTHPPRKNSDYCWRCIKAGRNDPWIECTYYEECHTVDRRRWRGQQYFICTRHKNKEIH